MIAVILAGGKSVRMNFSVPKVLQPVGDHPMIWYIISTIKRLKPDRILVVIGRNGEGIKTLFYDEGVEFVDQPIPLGTADAVSRCRDYLKNSNEGVMILCGDIPLISERTLKRLLENFKEKKADAIILTAEIENPTGYGRIVRRDSSEVEEIVEEKEATDEIKKIKEINSGIYVFKAKPLSDALKRITPSDRTGEYYLTDVIGEIINNGGRVVSMVTPDSIEIRGVNTPEEMAFIKEVMKKRWGSSKS